LVQSPICLQIGEEDIEDLAFILTLKDVGKSAEHVYQGISNCYLLRYFDNGRSLEAIPDGLCLPFYSSYGTDHKHDFALSVWSTILAMKTSMVAMLARAGGKLPKFLLHGSKPISTGCNHDVWLYLCRRLKDPYNRHATRKRIIKKTVQGCKAACVKVPRDSVSIDVIRLETKPEIDLWIELVDELNVIRSTTVDFGRWSTLVTSYRGGVDLEYKRNISLTLKSRCTRYKCQSTNPQTGFPADFPRVLEPFFTPVVEQVPNDSLISKWYHKNADPETDIWMCKKDGAYEYVGVYVDDLFIVSKNPKAITDALVDDYKFKLKGTGPVEFHLGCNFFRDEDGHLCFAPRKYVPRRNQDLPVTNRRTPMGDTDWPV
jgi:hypothetical protein